MKESKLEVPDVSKRPAIEVLNFIANLHINEPKSLEDLQGFFYEYHLGKVFSAILQTHGEVSTTSPDYLQLRGRNNSAQFLATYYPEETNYTRTRQATVHAYVMPVGEWNANTTFTFPEDSGIPIVERWVKREDREEWVHHKSLKPEEIFSEIQNLAGLMAEVFERLEPSEAQEPVEVAA